MKALGNQLIAELYGCDAKIIDSVQKVEQIFVEAANKANATVIEHNFHNFSPHGVSGAVIIKESHFAVHTWPEYGYCAVDIFTCGDLTDNSVALAIIKSGLQAEHISVTELRRGLLDLVGNFNKPSEKQRTDS